MPTLQELEPHLTTEQQALSNATSAGNIFLLKKCFGPGRIGWYLLFRSKDGLLVLPSLPEYLDEHAKELDPSIDPGNWCFL